MKKVLLIGEFLLLLFPLSVYAQRGCCSSHGGVCGCSKYGKQVCCDGSLSKTCTCDPPKVYGCTDYNANNYNSDANTDDGSCTYTIKGCTDPNANNYNSNANTDDGSCEYEVKESDNSKSSSAMYEIGNTHTTSEPSSSPIDGILGLLTIGGVVSGIGYAISKKKK